MSPSWATSTAGPWAMGTINGTYRLGVASPEASFLLVFHAPGTAQDYLWIPNFT